MADFDLVFTTNGGNVLPTKLAWVDPISAAPVEPSRQNPVGGLPHRYDSVRRVGPVQNGVTIEAHVGGVLLADGALGGRLFTWSWVDIPTVLLPIAPTGGTTAQVIFPADHFLVYPGLYTILAQRPQGGNVGISFEVEPFD